MQAKYMLVILFSFLIASCHVTNNNEDSSPYPELVNITLEDGKRIAFSEHPITIEQYSYFVESTRYVTDGERSSDESCWGIREDRSVGWMKNENWRDNRITQGPDYPVVCVSWNDATAYTRWLSQITGEEYRLPYVEEWEYAANRNSHTKYYYGNDPSKSCEYINHADKKFLELFNEYAIISPCDDGHKGTSPVGSYPSNINGLFDMYGNVWEWQLDCAGQEKLETDSCAEHLLRGGSWASNPNGIVIGYEINGSKSARTADYGFRVVRE